MQSGFREGGADALRPALSLFVAKVCTNCLQRVYPSPFPLLVAPSSPQVLRRTNRQGFKAGAMVEGMMQSLPFGFKYVAIFDADFEPAQ